MRLVGNTNAVLPPTIGPQLAHVASGHPPARGAPRGAKGGARARNDCAAGSAPYAQYVALERDSTTKHEFFDGEIYAIAGGSEDHAALAESTLAALLAAVGERPCRVSSSVLRIYVEAVGLATFPDGSVICGPMQQHPPSPDATALNPLILLEVTSDSSEEYDTNGKLEAYKTIPALREVILVSHRERRITIHRREADGTWVMRVAIAGGRVSVESLGTELIVDTIYRNSSIAR